MAARKKKRKTVKKRDSIKASDMRPKVKGSGAPVHRDGLPNRDKYARNYSRADFVELHSVPKKLKKKPRNK
jgi:hypothetical protein